MRARSPIIITGLIGALAVPLSARFVPGVRPWLDAAGLMQPLTALGVVPAESSEKPENPRGGAGGGAGPVVAQEVQRQPLQTVISAIGSARGVQAVDLSFEVSGRLTGLAVAPGQSVQPGEVIADLDNQAARLGATWGPTAPGWNNGRSPARQPRYSVRTPN